MRIWSIHPKYLDSKGLVALWRETLLAKNVLLGITEGYKNHPQLLRFKETKDPISSINTYLYYIYLESLKRGYSFNKSKFCNHNEKIKMKVTDKQLNYEFEHLLKKLKIRNIEKYKEIKKEANLIAHPIFEIKSGEIEQWEKTI
jgi:hypothetical protein